jgi:hypothetical protein
VQAGGDQFVLGPVVLVDGDLGDRCFRRHLIDADGPDPLTVEEPGRGVENPDVRAGLGCPVFIGTGSHGDLQGRRPVDSDGDGFVSLGALY